MSIKNPILNEEIFGPILPIVEYETIDEIIKFINLKKGLDLTIDWYLDALVK